MRLYRIIQKPIITEKASTLEMKESTYVMAVDPKATKIDIKKSILELYGIEIESVRIVNTRVKMKHGKKKMQIKRRTFKKAYVTLKDKSQKLDLISIK